MCQLHRQKKNNKKKVLEVLKIDIRLGLGITIIIKTQYLAFRVEEKIWKIGAILYKLEPDRLEEGFSLNNCGIFHSRSPHNELPLHR